MVVNPVNGKVYVANTEANNDGALRGPGIFAGHSLRGHLHESRITVLTPGGRRARRGTSTSTSTTTACCAPVPNAENEQSPRAPAGDGRHGERRDALRRGARARARSGSSPPAPLENDTFTPSAANHIPVHAAAAPRASCSTRRRKRLYVHDAVRQRDLDHRHRRPRAEIGARADAQPGAAERRGRPPRSSTTRRSRRATATRRARAATSSATSTAWRGTSAIRTRRSCDNPGPFASPLARLAHGVARSIPSSTR